ncbi:MAG TPA: adenylate/guanylate cyclase domain-containing protein [Acidobacteriota bacterium]|nr:adenylate/guanylate cyclase domain-containing protein [Acidobacteriota bacterium]HNT17824.1 adenylate/guanylate cyclase domain-containing protein [Acidobacteriota bacterium]HQO20710.1 adenylate/guanylate cyclase domain-containing protein [Acidobacteriota bacterium]
MTEREKLEKAIETLESQRSILGDVAVDTSISALKDKLKALDPAQADQEQRKQVTILFADISGFTSMSETMDAEDVTEIMNRLWERLDRIIVNNGGIIDKHIGDNVMAIWGAETSRENDPECALRAALALQEEIEALDRELNTESRLRLRIGVNSGPARLGRMGTTGEFTAMGDTVNTASRLESHAPVGGILISHDTYRLVQGIFDVRPTEPVKVKGKEKPIKAYVLLRARPRVFRIPARGVEGIETRMIGRDAELRKLQYLFKEVEETSSSAFVTIMGDAGVGKSRLLYEFTRWLDLLPEGVLFFKGRATPEMMNTPYSLVRDLFSFRFDIRESDSAAEMREKFRAGTAEHLERDRSDIMGHFIGFDFSESEAVKSLLGSPNFGKLAVSDLGMFFRSVGTKPAVVFLEDLHWADNSSIEMIEQLFNSVPSSKVMIVCLARPALLERRPYWKMERENRVNIDLRLLSPRDCRALVDEILKKVDDMPENLRELVAAGAEGNPFYVEELVKMLIEEGVIVRGEEKWKIEAGRLEKVTVPPTLTGVLQARLDSLPRKEKVLLQKASVIGRIFWDSAVSELPGSDHDESSAPDEISLLLESVRKRELVFPMQFSSFADSREYIFKHAILRDVTYETVLLKMRRACHAQVARWLEKNMKERRGEFLSLVAGHFELAGEKENAARYLFRSGRELHRISAFKDATDAFGRALELLPPGNDASRAEMLAEMGDALRSLGEYDRSVESFKESVELSAKTGEVKTLAAAHCGLGRIAISRGEYGEALPHLDEALRISRESGHEAGAAQAVYNLADAHFRLGNADAAERCARESLEIYERIGDRQGIALSHRVLGFAAMMRGDHEGAGNHHREHGRISEEIGDRWGVCTGLINLGETFRKRGMFEEAVGCWKQSLPIATEIGAKLSVIISHCNAGNVLAMMEGREKDAIDNLKQALILSQQIGSAPITLEVLVGVMHLRIRSSRFEEAAELAGLVSGHPAFNAEIKEYLDPIFAELGSKMEEKLLSEAVSRGGTGNLDETVKEIVEKE